MIDGETKIAKQYSCYKAGFKLCNFCESSERSVFKYSLEYKCWIDFFNEAVDRAILEYKEYAIHRIIIWKKGRYDQKSLTYLDYVLKNNHKGLWARLEKIKLLQ